MVKKKEFYSTRFHFIRILLSFLKVKRYYDTRVVDSEAKGMIKSRMAKQKFYVVWAGRKPGIYRTWADCEKQVKGYKGARFKSYESQTEAERAYEGKPTSTGTKKAAKSVKQVSSNTAEDVIWDSISVDVGSHGNPGKVEYKGVDTKTGAILFEKEPIQLGTNNMGEFLAIVHGLAYLKENQLTKPVYSDSRTAISWVKKKKANSTLVRNDKTREIWDLVNRAEQWLKENPNHHQVLKWNTEQHGEIKADYGRKS